MHLVSKDGDNYVFEDKVLVDRVEENAVMQLELSLGITMRFSICME
jgi:hypothetical protein